MKYKALLAVLVCVAMIGGCSGPKETNTPISPPDLSTEEGVKEYLVGEWTASNSYQSDVVCKMSIDKDLKVELSFIDPTTEESKGDYKGQIELDRIYAEPPSAPDTLRIELEGTDYTGGEFFFLHRTIYDGKRTMSWFLANGENCIFEMLGPEGVGFVPGEIIFEKVTGESSQLQARKNEEFEAVFWGKGADGQSLWFDDAICTPSGADDELVYPRMMTYYENDVLESVLYGIAPDQMSEVLGDDLFQGEVYYVETNEQGQITELMPADRKRFMDSGSFTVETQLEIIDIISSVEEVKEYLDLDMSILITGETTILDGEECYDVSLGTDHEDQFVQEAHYAVNIFTRQVYYYDVLNDEWFLL